MQIRNKRAEATGRKKKRLPVFTPIALDRPPIELTDEALDALAFAALDQVLRIDPFAYIESGAPFVPDERLRKEAFPSKRT